LLLSLSRTTGELAPALLESNDPDAAIASPATVRRTRTPKDRAALGGDVTVLNMFLSLLDGVADPSRSGLVARTSMVPSCSVPVSSGAQLTDDAAIR
jgi:hypothetical protein